MFTTFSGVFPFPPPRILLHLLFRVVFCCGSYDGTVYSYSGTCQEKFSIIGTIMTKGSGSGKTPKRVVSLLVSEVEKKGVRKVATEAGLGVAAVHRYCQGIGEPTIETLEKLSKYFEIPVMCLIDSIVYEMAPGLQSLLENISNDEAQAIYRAKHADGQPFIEVKSIYGIKDGLFASEVMNIVRKDFEQNDIFLLEEGYSILTSLSQNDLKNAIEYLRTISNLPLRPYPID
jgi:transcriptional regulator with XRE-family HTH domain